MKDELLFCPLGGSGEIGMNMNLFAYGKPGEHKWIMVDIGVTFADDTVPGIDLIYPDPGFIVDKKEDLLGIILTHAHEDHIGAIAHLWPQLKCKIFATPFTAVLIKEKFKEKNIDVTKFLKIVQLNGTVNLDPFKIEYITLTHSILEPNGLRIETPAGVILHTGDWKIDPEPLIGEKINSDRLKEIGKEGVLAMICDSTNVFSMGKAGSELDVRKSLLNIMGSLKKRIVMASFASNVARMETAFYCAEKTGRQISLVGRSMHRIFKAARQCGYLKNVIEPIDPREAKNISREKIVYLCTGSQGEYRAALSKIARDQHQHIVAEKGDTVIFSSKIIPGNESGILNLQNLFAKKGVNIITGKDEFIHVSGHPCQDELLEMFSLIKPTSIIPVHGEFRHLTANASLAEANGIKKSLVIENGTMVKVSKNDIVIETEVENGRLYKDGKIIVYDYESPSNERSKLSQTGLIIVSLVLVNNKIKSKPAIKTFGIPEFDKDGIRFDDWVMQALNNVLGSKNKGGNLESKIRNSIVRQIKSIWGKKPKVEIIFN